MKNSSAPIPYVVIVLVLATLGIWLVSIFFVTWSYPDWTIRGAVGDSFGAVNSLFSGLGLIGIVYAILLQREDLRLQKLELRQSRESQMESSQFLKHQTLSLKRSVEMSATSALLTYYVQERELAKERNQHDYKDIVQKKIREIAMIMEKQIKKSCAEEIE